MKIAVLCEWSGTVRDEFLKAGHDAISCDLLPTESPGPHIQGDCRDYDWSGYDLVIAHPPCQYLSTVANRAMKENPQRIIDRQKALAFFLWCYYLPAEKVCVENPTGYVNSQFRKPDQIIHPYFFGDREMKRTCLWLRGLPPLIHSEEHDLFFKKTHTKKPEPYYQIGGEKKKGQNVYFIEAQTKDKNKVRSKFFPGIAKAMAEQWGQFEKPI